jgi:hypothetical protein
MYYFIDGQRISEVQIKMWGVYRRSGGRREAPYEPRIKIFLRKMK